MANLDTQAKRSSSVQFGLPFLFALPEPDGAMDFGDRAHGVHLYAGALILPTPACLHIDDAVVTDLVISDALLTSVVITDAVLHEVAISDSTC